tara:strand:+ start:1360 stop:2463 length:1104 start_codon:yes stop_codon:yes gene_type:complete
MEEIMNKTKGPSIYYFHDKAIHDGLSQHNVSKNKTKQMLLDKGVFVSDSDDKDEYVEYLSSYIFDFKDKDNLSQILQVVPRREHVKSIRINDPDENTAISNENVRQALKNIKDSFSQDDDVEVKVLTTINGSSIEVHYKKYDLTKPEMKQVEQKKATIEILVENGGLTVRAPANDFSEKIVDSFKSYVAQEVKSDLKTEEINLSGVFDYSLITKFFQLLINQIDGYVLHDVTNVKLYHPVSETEVSEDSEDSVSLSNIKRAILHGEKVLISPELNLLFERGFHISFIQWTSDDSTTSSGDRISFEASLKDPLNKTDFTYQVRGIQRYSDRTSDITNRLTIPSNIEKRNLHNLLEVSAQKAFMEVSSS